RRHPGRVAASVRAAAAGVAAVGCARHRRGLDLVLRLEGAAAAAGRDDVGVLDLEPGAHQAVDVVDTGALEVRQAVPIDDHPDAVVLPDLVVLLGRRVE